MISSVATTSDDLASLRRQVEQLREERDHLLVHTQGLEAELRRLRTPSLRGTDPGALHPGRFLRRTYRLFRESVPWRVLRRFPGLRRRLARLRA